MKILKIDPHPVPYSWAWSCERALKQLGVDISMFFYRDHYLQARIWRWAKAKLPWLLKMETRQMNRHLLATAARQKPEIAFFSKGELGDAATLQELKKIGCRLVNWISDDPFRYLSIEVMREYDYFFVYDPYFLDPLAQKGVKKPLYLPLACDEEVFKPVDLTREEKIKYGSDLCFIGTYDQARESLLAPLAKKYNLRIWGPGWKKHAVNDNLKHCLRDGFYSPRDINKIYNASKICLNLHHAQTVWGVNMRAFEATASGCLLVTDNPKELGALFDLGREVVVYQQEKDLPDLLDHYLSHDGERAAIAAAGQRKAHQEHTYLQRLKKILAVIKEQQNV